MTKGSDLLSWIGLEAGMLSEDVNNNSLKPMAVLNLLAERPQIESTGSPREIQMRRDIGELRKTSFDVKFRKEVEHVA